VDDSEGAAEAEAGDDLVDPTDVVGRRVAGWLVDATLVAASALVVLVMLGDSFERPGSGVGLELRQVGSDTAIFFRSTVAVIHTWEWLVTAAVAGLVAVLMLVVLPGRRGWTPGLLAADLRLVDEEGERTGVRRALVRFGGWLIDLLPGVPLVGFAAMRVGRHHQRVGDRMAHTYVVDAAFAGRAPTEPAPADDRAQHPTVVAEPAEAEGGVPATTGVVGEAARLPRRGRRRRRVEPDEETSPAAGGPASTTAWAPTGSDPEPGSAGEPSGGGREGDPAERVTAEAGAGDRSERRAGPPDGVDPDQPLWDRRRRRYVMWHSRTDRWVAFDDEQERWTPL
jgi:uncharacterized RDD family membrane protein YckC